MDRFTSFNCNYRLYHKELNKKQPKKKKNKNTYTQSTKHDYLVSTATKHCIAFTDSSIIFFVNCSHV